MEKFVIHGGKPLHGTVQISGAKNAAVALVAATILCDEPCVLENVPEISDITKCMKILREMGAEVRLLDKNTIYFDTKGIEKPEVPYELARTMRASCYFLGTLLGRFHEAFVPMPGGCDLGDRPIDQHLKAFKALGASDEIVNGANHVTADELVGNQIYFDFVTVGATMNAIFAAVKAKGLTIIENAAKEPHIVDLANFLNAMGAKVSGAGTDVIKIRGVRSLHGGNYSIIPDQIETGTYMAAVAATGGDVLIQNVIPKHMDCISAKLREMGVKIAEYDDAIRVQRTGVMRRANVKTMPYPGFPTDMQPQIAVCMSLASGVSVITESIYDTRFGYCAELNRMGASIKVDTKVAIITGVEKLHGCTVRACDLRAGAAMVIAGLAADRTTTIEDIEYIERGYENLIGKLTAIGAEIRRVSVPDGTAVPAAV